MTFTLSPPVRYAAALALLAAVLLGGGMTMLGHSKSPVAAPHVIKHHPFGPGLKKKATVVPKKHSPKAVKAKAAPTVPPVAESTCAVLVRRCRACGGAPQSNCHGTRAASDGRGFALQPLL